MEMKHLKMLINRKDDIMKKIFWMIIFIAGSFVSSYLGAIISCAIWGSSDAADIIGEIIGFMIPSAGAIILGVMWIADLKYGTDDENKANK